MIILLTGLPASGKSTLIPQLIERFEFLFEREAVFPNYTVSVFDGVMDTPEEAQEVIALNNPSAFVIVEARAQDAGIRQIVRDALPSNQIVEVWVHAHENVLKQRRPDLTDQQLQYEPRYHDVCARTDVFYGTGSIELVTAIMASVRKKLGLV